MKIHNYFWHPKTLASVKLDIDNDVHDKTFANSYFTILAYPILS